MRPRIITAEQLAELEASHLHTLYEDAWFGWLRYVYLVAAGQFHDIEEAKYRMLEEREPEPWPERKGGLS